MTARYLGNAPLTKTSYNSIEVVATEGQTVFTVDYNPSFLDVLVNGIELAKSDYTAVDGSTVTLNNGVTAGHIVTFKVWRTFNVINAVTTENVDQTVLGTKTFQDGAIVNNSITGTAVTQSATDTTTGRLLKVGDFGLGGSNSVTLAGDVNDYRTPGFVGTFAGISDVLNRPFNTSYTFVLSVIGTHMTDRVIQLAQTAHTSVVTQGFWMRFSIDATTWTSWQKIYHTSNILGTVSQSGGVPTGAVIERGSNANGEYVKYADGTMICSYVGGISGTATTSSIMIYDIKSYPAIFIAQPSVVFTQERETGDTNGTLLREAVLSNYLDIWSTNAGYRINAQLPSNTGFVSGVDTFSVIAIGRWF